MGLALAQSAATVLQMRPARPSLPMRLALGLLHRGPLFMTGRRGVNALSSNWRSRQDPDASVSDQTVEALERRGWAQVTDYQDWRARRWCALLTPEGEATYRAAGGLHAGAARPPPEAELTLERFDEALAAIRAELAGLAGEAARIGPRVKVAREEIAQALRETERVTGRIAELTRLAGALGERRDAMRALLIERRR
jgi:hypothetical protein